MGTVDEVKAARDVVQFARAGFIIREIEGEATEEDLKALLELMVWAYRLDRGFDWVWHMKDCPLLQDASSFVEAAKVVERWFDNDEFPLNEKWHDDLNIFENWILPVLDKWADDKLEDYLANSTWKGVKGNHSVNWDPEKGGHVVVFDGDDLKPVFDYQL